MEGGIDFREYSGLIRFEVSKASCSSNSCHWITKSIGKSKIRIKRTAYRGKIGDKMFEITAQMISDYEARNIEDAIKKLISLITHSEENI